LVWKYTIWQPCSSCLRKIALPSEAFLKAQHSCTVSPNTFPPLSTYMNPFIRRTVSETFGGTERRIETNGSQLGMKWMQRNINSINLWLVSSFDSHLPSCSVQKLVKILESIQLSIYMYVHTCEGADF
jgi:hypothetical protein